MTPIFAAADKNKQAGLTLLELLMALALLGLFAAAAASGLRMDAAHVDVKLASERLLADLKQARRAAETSGAPVRIAFGPDHYAVAALDLDRPLPRGVDIAVTPGAADASDIDEIAFGPGLRFASYRIAVSKGSRRASIVIDPLTHRITLQ